jgi:hypothetical protein
MRLPLVFNKSIKDMAFLLTNYNFLLTQLSNTKLIKVDVSDTSDTSQFVDWLVSALVCDIKTANEEARAAKEKARAANEEARTANEEARAAKEEARAANEEARSAKEEARAANEEARAAKEEAKNLKISLDFNTEIEMFLKDEKIHELKVCIENLKDDVQKIKDVVK